MTFYKLFFLLAAAFFCGGISLFLHTNADGALMKIASIIPFVIALGVAAAFVTRRA